jgi:Tfp pilus assembly protein PilF
VFLAGSLLLASVLSTSCLVRKGEADAHYSMANSFLQQGRGIWDESNRRKAYPELSTAIDLDPQNPKFHLLMGTLYRFDGKLILAEKEVKKALIFDPNLGDAHNNLGVIYFEQGNLTMAIEEFKKAIGNLSYQTVEFAYFNLGRAGFKLGDYGMAAEALERSLDILPANEEARFLLGRCYAKMGRLVKAEKAFSAALAMKSDSPRTHYELGVVLFKQDRKAEAADHFEKVVLLDPQGEMAEKSRTYIKLLR